MSTSPTIVAKVTAAGQWSYCRGDEWIEMHATLGLLLVAFDAVGGHGAASFVSTSGTTDALIASLDQAIKGKWTGDVQVKLVGETRLIAEAQAACQRRHWRVVATKEAASGETQAYFCPTGGKLRIERRESVAPPSKTRVLIVDDSKTIRQVMRSILTRDPDIEVVGECENPLDVEKAILDLRPNVLSLDINMPEMDGVTLVKRIIPQQPLPIIMVTALSMDQGDQVMQALAAGAVDYIQKPSLNEIDSAAADICQRFKMAVRAKVRTTLATPRPTTRRVLQGRGQRPIILIGSSTGGTEAIREILLELPANIPPILIVQHIPEQFSQAFANRLAKEMPFEVKEARDGDAVQDGRVLIAPGGSHMALDRSGNQVIVKVYNGPTVSGHKPSVDVLFRSGAALVGKGAIGVILTGMGKDGAEGLRELRQTGARTIGQNEATCVVYGMPAQAKRLGAVEVELPIQDIARTLVDYTDNWGNLKASKTS